MHLEAQTRPKERKPRSQSSVTVRARGRCIRGRAASLGHPLRGEKAAAEEAGAAEGEGTLNSDFEAESEMGLQAVAGDTSGAKDFDLGHREALGGAGCKDVSHNGGSGISKVSVAADRIGLD